MMQVFISWSGEQTRALGHALKEFVDTTFAGHIDSFLSDADIAPGERFLSVINDSLDASVIGIVLLTRANMSEPWILFEAGALAGKTDSGSVIPLLVDLDRAELSPPLSQFQNVYGSIEADVRRLCTRLNAESGQKLSTASFELLFADAWPRLNTAIDTARDAAASPIAHTRHRDQREVLDEILLGINALVRHTNDATPALIATPDSFRSATVRDNGDLHLFPGDVISHTEFGEGTVTQVTGQGSKRVAQVAFTHHRLKKLLVKIAPIEIINRAHG